MVFEFSVKGVANDLAPMFAACTREDMNLEKRNDEGASHDEHKLQNSNNNREEKMSWLANEAEDYWGNPADRAKTGGWVPSALILGIEMVERLATMGIAVNLVTYLNGAMHLPSSSSANIVTDFMGTSFLLCLLGGFLADSYLGRYWTIIIFSAVQAVGAGLLSMSTALPQLRPPPCHHDGNGIQTCQQANMFQMSILYLSLYLMALGTGGLKCSVSGFGSDQFDEKDEKESQQMAYFFSRFFFFISLGTLLAVTILVWIQDEVGRSWGYGICSVAMIFAIIVFLAGRKKYRYRRRLGSLITHILEVVVSAVKKRKMELPQNPSFFYEEAPDGTGIQHTDQFRFLDKAAIATEDDFEAGASKPNPWKLSPVTRVEEVKMMIRLVPIWATTIIFWTVYAQMITFSVEQASTMDRSMGHFQIPAGSLPVFFVAAILITLAIYDRFIIPFSKRWKGFTNLQQMAIGLILSIFGMAAASLIERKRLDVAKSAGGVISLPISVFYLVPQLYLIGSGEAFIYTGQLDFFITQSPKGMKTMSTGLFLTTLSLGFFVSSFLVSILKGITGSSPGKAWLADNINNGRLDLFYALLAILSVINFVLFIISAIWYKPAKPNKGSQRPQPAKQRC
ncbi:NRT1/ PTR FAMILY 6.2-like protein [Drosera capensis]